MHGLTHDSLTGHWKGPGLLPPLCSQACSLYRPQGYCISLSPAHSSTVAQKFHLNLRAFITPSLSQVTLSSQKSSISDTGFAV